MAEKENKTPEQIKKEKEWKVREQAERKELKKRQKEKAKKEKKKRKRIRKREKKEIKRINEKIKFPFIALMKFTMVIALLFFLISYFGWEVNLINSIFYSFLIFASLYLLFGIVMVTIFFSISEIKKRELEEQKRIEMEQKLEEERRIAEEHAELERNLREEYERQQNFLSQESKKLEEKNQKEKSEPDKQQSDETEYELVDSIIDKDINTNPFIDENNQEENENDSIVDEDFIDDILTDEEKAELSRKDKDIKSNRHSEESKTNDKFEPFIENNET